MNDSIEWIHFGGCYYPRMFNQDVLGEIATDEHGSVPIEYVTLYRRGVAFLVQEWASLAKQPVGQTPADAQFLKAWCPGPDTFNQADIVFTNVVLDNLYPRQPVVGQGRLRTSPVPISQVIHNFPLEPSARLTERFVVADATCEDIALAWEEFLTKVTQPVVVCLLFCTRNRMQFIFPEHVYRNLYELQDAIRPVFARHHNALVLEVDELIDCTNGEFYKDHHHLTPAGESALRAALIVRLRELGIIDRLLTGRHSCSLPFAGFPDRADFVTIEESLVDFCARFYKAPLLIGPDRITRTMSTRLETRRCRPVIVESMAALPPPDGIDGVIYLKWTQHTSDPPWLKALRTRYPGAFIELVSHWRPEAVLSAEESAFAASLRTLATAEGRIGSGIWSIADREFRRYAVRVLAEQLFRAIPLADFDFERFVPTVARRETAGAEAERLYEQWKSLRRSNVFSSRGRMASPARSPVRPQVQVGAPEYAIHGER